SVHPWKINGKIVGYIELGKEIRHFAPKLRRQLSADIIFTIKKSLLNRDIWQKRGEMLPLAQPWDLLPNKVITNHTLPQIKSWIVEALQRQHDVDNDIFEYRDMIYHLGRITLYDAAERDVGEIALIADITTEMELISDEWWQLISYLISTLVALGGYIYYGRRQEIKLQAENQKNIEITQALQESQKTLHRAMEVSKLGSWKVDLTTEKINLSPESYRLLNLSTNLAISFDHIIPIIHPEDIDRVESAWNKALQGAPYDLKHRVIIENETRWVRVKAEIEFDSTGGALRAIGIVHDISDQKAYENQLANSAMELEREVTIRTSELQHAKVAAEVANEAKASFLANMSHEIRTPMSAILGMTQLCLKTEINSVQKHYLDQVENSTKLLLQIINEILDFEKIEAQQMKIECNDFDLLEIFDLATSSVAVLAAKKGISLKLDVEDYVPTKLVGDALRIGQVLINLLTNAVKFTDQGGVKVRVSRLNSDDNCILLKFEVIDNGIGISDSYQKELFQPFTQADSSTSRKFGGTGLGLSISKGLVDAMDGSIEITSEEGKGTTFSFTLPLTISQNPLLEGEVHLENRHQDMQQSLKAISNTNILLAEDNEINQELALEILGSYGLVVEVANNGVEAVELAKNKRFDLILMDIQMPIMDGRVACQAIRKEEESQPATWRTPILAMTAHAFSEDRRKCLDAGMDDVITKPIDIPLLESALLRWIKPGRNISQSEATSSAQSHTKGDMRFPNQKGVDFNDALSRLNGKDKVLTKLLLKFKQSKSNTVIELKELLDSGQRESAERLAHSTKGVALQLGATALGQIMLTCETGIKQGAKSDELPIEQAQLELSRFIALIAKLPG
ncbi:MAG: response regulator, partial [Bdellovibrionales bacterium]|nr:response regulator [Bdellovibrionales bacterium]